MILNRLSLRSKLIMILLGVSLLASLIVIGLGYFVGVESFSREVYEQLASTRNAKAFEIEEYFDNVSKITEVMAANELTAEATIAFSSAFRQIENTDTINCTADLNDFYADYLDKLGKVLEVRRDMSAFYPKSAAACYLQYHYIVKQRERDSPAEVADANDGSAYSNVHRQYHEFFRRAMEKFGFYDIFLIDIQTESIVYSVMKEADYATSLREGPYRNSNLANLVDAVKRNADLDEAQVVDFAFYRPSFGAPAAFIGAPVFYRKELVGFFAGQLSIDRINYIMNYGQEWEANGLGQTGEVMLVGEDYLLRSDTRKYLEDPEGFIDLMRGLNLGEERMHMLEKVGPILVTELRSDNIMQAMRGKTGMSEVESYHGERVLSAFRPLDLPSGLRWALVTEIDEGEALAPVDRFQRLNFSALAFIIGLITVLAMLIARSFIRPIDRLTEGAEAVRAGDTGVKVVKTTDDEMGRLTEVFNEMVAGIDEQKNEIARQARENDALLFSRFPASIAERYRAGEATIVDAFDGVSVLSLDLRATDQLNELPEIEAWSIIQDVAVAFNLAAEKFGIEVIHPVPDGYLAVCGMNIPRLDNARRIALFTMELRKIIQEKNQQHNLSLELNVGLAYGSVLAGILQDETKNYIVWGQTVDLAQRLAYGGKPNEIRADGATMELLEGSFAFTGQRRESLANGQSVLTGRLAERIAVDTSLTEIDAEDDETPQN